MNRRQFLKSATALPLLNSCSHVLRTSAKGAAQPVRRVRPGDPSCPSEASWNRLRREVRSRLITVESPLTACQTATEGTSCAEVFKELKNPYYIGDQPALTQTSGWVDAWTSAPGVYAVAAVNFARENNLRLVVKGGSAQLPGHLQLGGFAAAMDAGNEQYRSSRCVCRARLRCSRG